MPLAYFLGKLKGQAVGPLTFCSECRLSRPLCNIVCGVLTVPEIINFFVGLLQIEISCAVAGKNWNEHVMFFA